nr:hypothetical protein [Gammaproteobacteria bacterium]
MSSNQTSTKSISLSIELRNDDQLSTEDLDQMTRLMQDEIEEHIDIQSIQLSPGGQPIPEGTKAAGEAVTIGMLLLQVLPATLPALMSFFQEWTLRPGNRPVKIKTQVQDRSIEVEFDPRVSSADEIAALTQKFQTMLTEKPEDSHG